MDYFAFVQYLSYILTNRSTLSYKGHYNPYFLAKKQTKGTEKFKINIQLASKKADSQDKHFENSKLSSSFNNLWDFSFCLM